MPSVIVPLPVPIVPLVLGVPPLPIFLLGVPPAPNVFAPLPILAFADTAALANVTQQNQWGILDSSGNPVLTVDSVASIEYARDYRISDYTQEQGKFESYNKVQIPYEAKVGFLVGPSRFEFLNEIEAKLASLDFVSVVTPEVPYANANLTHYGYRRVERKGVTLMLVEVWCEEVRFPGTATFSNAQSPNGQPIQQNGTAQPIQADTPPVTSDGTVLTQPPPTLSPSFYAPLTIPPPNSYSALSGTQQQAFTQLGAQQNAGSAFVTAPDQNGNAIGSFQ